MNRSETAPGGSFLRPFARFGVRIFATALFAIALPSCDVFLSADTRAERAREHMAAGDYRRAVSELKNVLEDEPRHVQSRLLLAELSLRLGDIKGADKELRRAIAAGAERQATQKLRYGLLLAQRQWEDLLKELTQDELTPAIERQLLEAQARIGLGQYAEAEQALDRAAKTGQQNSGVLLQRARVLVATNRADEALALLERISEPDGVRSHALTVGATILTNRGQYQRARQMLTEALELAKRDLSVPEQLLVAVGLTEASMALQDLPAASSSLAFIEQRAADTLVAHYYRARIALLKNDYAVAVAECQRALAIDPRHVPSNLMLAAAHIGHGSLEQGEDVLRSLLVADPQNLAARKLLAQVYLTKRRPADARRLLESQGVGAQDDAQVDWLMGVALTQSGETESGLAYLERSVAAAAPDDARRLDLATAYLGAGAPEKAREILAALPDAAAESNRAAALSLATAVAGKTPAAARKEVERLVAASSADARLLSAAGAYLFGVGDLRRSHEVLTQAAGRDPKALNARMMLALLAANSSDWKAATRRIDEVLAIDPAYQPAFLTRAEIELKRGERVQAQRTLEQAIGRNPAALEPRLRLARLAFANKDPARGRDLLKQTVALFPGRADVRNSAGMVLSQAGLHEEALVHFAEAGAAGLPEGMLNAARLQIQLNRLEQASETANAALALRPGWGGAQAVLIEIDVRRGQLQRALARARKLAGESPPGVMQELEGDVYRSAKRFVEALAAYEQAQQLHPSASLALKIFSARQALDRKPVEASLVSWLGRHPDDRRLRRILAGYYELHNQRRAAIAQYELAVKQSPEDPLLLNNLAWQLYVDGDARAPELARRAYDLGSHIPEISDTYGWLLVQTGEMQRGLEVLEQALAGAPANPDIRYHVAAARSKSGNRSSALQILDELLKERTAFPSRAEAERLLQSLRGEGA